MGSFSNMVQARQGALRRAFCLAWSPRQCAFLVSVLLHAVLLLTVLVQSQKPDHHGRRSKAQAERPASQQSLKVTLVKFIAQDTTASKTAAVRTWRQVAGKTTLAVEARKPEQEAAASPVTPSSPQTVQGLALPQPMLIPGRRSLWSFQPSVAAPDAHALYQAEMRRQSVTAMQTLRQAARGKFEAQLMATLGDMQLQASCRLILAPDGAITVSCDDEQDRKLVAAVLERSGNAPAMQDDSTAIIIDLTPQFGGGLLAVVARRAQSGESLF